MPTWVIYRSPKMVCTKACLIELTILMVPAMCYGDGKSRRGVGRKKVVIGSRLET